MTRSRLALVLTVVVVHLACDRSERPMPAAADGAVRASAAPAAMSLAESAAQPAAPQAPGQAPTTNVPSVSRKIIRNGTLDMQVTALEPALKALRAEVERAGGYSADESQSTGDDGAKQASVTVRLPAARFDASLAAIQGLGRVERVTITGEDITEQYYDLEVQLKNRKQLEVRMLALLERQSNRLSELLEIEREVGRIRSEIDGLAGKQRFWDSQVSLSRLVVNLREPVPLGRGGILDRFRRAFRTAGDNLLEATTGLIAVSGALLPVLIVAWLCWLVVRKVWRRRGQKPTPAPSGQA
jgi:hypothetical protein